MALTIAKYLQVLPNYTFPENIVERALGTYELDANTPAFDVPERERDLAEAMMWDSAAGLVNGGAYKKQIGNRSITTANLQTSQQDRTAWSARAAALRAKWGVEQVEDVSLIKDYTNLW
jgi:hypothetical protein